jgi:hypothetical protein
MDDAFFEPLLFVYGTTKSSETALARRTIEKLKKPLRGITAKWPVKADKEVTEDDIERYSLVLVGTPGGNSLLKRIQEKLPIRVEDGAVLVGQARYKDPTVAASFIHPNPLNPSRYVVVHTGASTEALFYTAHLPGLLPDYVVYDASAWGRKGGRVLEDRQVLTAGFFDKHWKIAN